jgi:hypothetical protein
VPFLQNEDAALKAKLQGLTVIDATSDPVTNRRVEVRFKNPEYEFADAEYPLILISHTFIERSSERESRGYVTLRYAPEGYEPWGDMADPNASPYTTQSPIPVDVHYGIQVFTRKQPHLIQLTNNLMEFYHLPQRIVFLSIHKE